MLNEVELLVGGRSPEVLAVIGQVLFLLLPLLVGHGDRGFLTEGRIGQHIVHPVAGIGQQRVSTGNGHIAEDVSDVMQVQVHQA